MAKILVASDDMALIDTLAAEMSGMGHQIIAAGDGQEALALAEREHPDIVFLAAAMPVFDGVECARILRANPDFPPSFPVILISGEPRNPVLMEQAKITHWLSPRHNAAELRELLSQYS